MPAPTPGPAPGAPRPPRAKLAAGRRLTSAARSPLRRLSVRVGTSSRVIMRSKSRRLLGPSMRREPPPPPRRSSRSRCSCICCCRIASWCTSAIFLGPSTCRSRGRVYVCVCGGGVRVHVGPPALAWARGEKGPFWPGPAPLMVWERSTHTCR
eukprot:344112-Chlamydomonas_euryale.AAC.1